jgi:hypothetical protein
LRKTLSSGAVARSAGSAGHHHLQPVTKTLLRLSEKDLVGLCQTETTALAMKEFDPQLALELLNVLSKCRLGDVKTLRCSSDVQRPGYFDEVP